MCNVSVIIPVYNVERYLPACLDSVLCQTLRDLEVICVDDCSPDRCGEILDGYAESDDRVRVIHLQENRRQGFARNRGMERATGKYLYFLDSDDAIEPETLEELYELAERENLDAIFFDSKDVYENEELKKIYVPQLSKRKGEYRDEVYAGKELLDAFIRQNEWTCYPQRIFWRREFILEEGIRYPEDCEHEDEFFAFAGILAAERVRYVPKQYFTLRIRPNSVMTSEHAPKNFHGYLMNYYYMNRFVSERDLCTDGAEINIHRMHERVMTLFSKLKDNFDLGEVFRKEPDRTIYRCFISHMQAQEAADRIDPEVLERIRRHRIVYIYGARQTGQRFCEKLEKQEGILIGDFLAQYPEDVRSALMGRCVKELDDASIPEDAIVVVATKMMYWEETRTLLEERNINCVFHKKI